MSDETSDLFFEAYDRDDIAYGLVPSGAVAAFLDQFGKGGRAIDLGAGAGRDTLALAKAGYEVTSVDISERGLERIVERAKDIDVEDLVWPLVCDVREVTIDEHSFDAVIATTVLDHIPADDAKLVWKNMVRGLNDRGLLFVEVHTTEDPGSPEQPGCDSAMPMSETANAVINYFKPNQLAAWAIEPESQLRILHYEERLEWDYTHGDEHMHGKAILLAVREGYHPSWYGQPAAFPRKS
ncbi:class I SAM-dependent methyltransferase [Rubripirellula amarantea]|uniref:Tellurite methyltransferase n=1 Tax=Rubripirellula amarantea TaxID=2527999 RepID=A0A5C5WQ89_9BACT|nr:class I SAM-dependent methyltransferase [Rubripirellula amarantea]MDA8743616.1 class I SAM-dependent methyltransferase [Rubripirellula amarantea]TWT52435.1 Tellurite methyltransferase [Rubripirellula amarantea]